MELIGVTYRPENTCKRDRRKVGYVAMGFGLSAMLFATVAGCSPEEPSQAQEEAPAHKRILRFRSYQEVFGVPEESASQKEIDVEIVEVMKTDEYRALKDMYNSIDLASLSDDEGKWLEEVDGKEFVDGFEDDLEPKSVEILGTICDLENPTDKEVIFLYRITIRELKHIANSIDLSSLSDEERKWLDELDRKQVANGKLANAARTELPPKLAIVLAATCNLENPTDRDLIFLYRVLKPYYEAINIMYMINASRN